MGILEGKIILVSKATEFVGAETCRSCLAEGATVIAQDPTFSDPATKSAFERDLPELELTASVIPDEIMTDIIDSYRRIDGLVPNDGFPAIRSSVENADPADMRAGLEAMVVEPFQLIGAAVKHMKSQGYGRIVMATSAAPLRGVPHYGMYVTGRGAQNAMVITLARELAKNNITVNAVAPNFVESPSYFSADLLEDETTISKILSQIPMGRIGKPQEVSDLIAFFLSDKAGFTTGHVVPVAGGWA